MATVNRPPFWVPRGDQQDTVWYAQPLKSPIIPFLTEQKIFGAGGQVPTKRWLPYLTYDDPPMWQGAPLNSGAIQVTKTQVKFFGQPGQAPTKEWVPYLLYDDPPMWPGSPLPSRPLVLTTTELKWYGAPGQVPTKPWARWLTYDDASSWQWPLYERNPNVLKPSGQPFSNRQWQWSDDPSYWSGEPVNSAVIQILTAKAFYGQGGQVPPFRPNFTLDDPPQWQGAPRAAVSLNIPGIRFYGQIGQVPPFRPNFTYDDASYWSGEPINSAAIQLLTQQQIFGQGGQVPPFRWNYTYDDPSYWSGEPINSAVLQLLTAQKVYGQGGQVPPFRWNWGYDDASYWSGEPINSAAIQLLTQQQIFGQGGQVPPYRWNYTLDDPASWSPTVERNLSLFFPTHNPFSNRQWQWSDDASGWQGAPVRSAAIPLLTQQQIFGAGGQVPPFRWNATYDDASPWQWPLYERNANVLQPSGQPFSNRQLQWQMYDDAAVWQGTPTWSATITLSGFHLYSPRSSLYFWRTYLDDWSTWQWPLYERNLNVLQPSGEPFSIRQPTWYSEDSFWQGSPLTRNPNVLQPSGEPFNNYKTYWYLEDVGWQGAPLKAATLGLPQQNPFSNRATYWYSEDAWWNAKPVSSAAITLTTTQVKFFGQPGQAPPFRWNYTLDDPPMWPGPVPRGSAVIQLPKTTTFYGQAGQVPTKCWAQYYTVDVPPMWQGAPASFNYLLTQPSPPAKPSGNDWIDFRRRARRR